MTAIDVDDLAQIIRQVDGNHDLGAGALAEAILDRLPAPQIIRTVEELEALDPDTLLIRSAQDWADPQIPMLATEWASDWEIEPDGIFPLATIATADQVRAARKALEEA